MITYYELLEDGSVGFNTTIKKVADFYKLKHQTEKELIYGYNGKLYVQGEEPTPPVEYQNEQIRQQRQQRYVLESDPLRLDYDEALAREQDNAEQLKQNWLASKDKIREELPYIIGE